MNREAALYDFFSGFGLTAYPTTSVPDNAPFPYLTYELVISDWNSGNVNVTVNLYFRTTSEAIPNAKVREIEKVITLGGVTVPCDNGMIWVRRGTPWSQAVIETEDSGVKRRYMNFDMEFLTVE